MRELDTDTIHRFIEDMVGKDLFSGVVLIAKDKKPIFNQAYSLASIIFLPLPLVWVTTSMNNSKRALATFEQ